MEASIAGNVYYLYSNTIIVASGFNSYLELFFGMFYNDYNPSDNYGDASVLVRVLELDSLGPITAYESVGKDNRSLEISFH